MVIDTFDLFRRGLRIGSRYREVLWRWWANVVDSFSSAEIASGAVAEAERGLLRHGWIKMNDVKGLVTLAWYFTFSRFNARKQAKGESHSHSALFTSFYYRSTLVARTNFSNEVTPPPCGG